MVVFSGYQLFFLFSEEQVNLVVRDDNTPDLLHELDSLSVVCLVGQDSSQFGQLSLVNGGGLSQLLDSLERSSLALGNSLKPLVDASLNDGNIEGLKEISTSKSQ